MELNFEGLEMQKWNISTNSAQRADEKNGIICLVIMFTPGGIQLLHSHLGGGKIYQNANVCKQGRGVVVSLHTFAHNFS